MLENVFDPHNISAVMRSCDSVGIQDVYVLNTRIPPHKKWGAKSSSSAHKWLTIHQFTHTGECFEALRRQYDKILTTLLGPASQSIYNVDLTGSMAIVFGNEHSGVSTEAVELSDGNMMIPQVGIIQSLNISVACAVTIYEAFRQKMAAGHYNQPSLPASKLNHLLSQWGFNNTDNNNEDEL